MRALIHTQNPSSLKLSSTNPLPTPNLTANEHLLKVHALSLTRWELLWPRPSTTSPYSPGVEALATTITSPPGSPFPPNTRVYFRTTYPRSGNAREYTIALTSELAVAPCNLSDEEAAAVPVSALTAWQGLFVHGGCTPPPELSEEEEASNGDRDGERDLRSSSHSNSNSNSNSNSGPGITKRHEKKRILVNGAAGSVGLWYVMLASAAGHSVTGTCKTSDIERVRAAGATEVVDYTTIPDLKSWAQGLTSEEEEKFDLVLDTVGGTSLEGAWFAAKTAGGGGGGLGGLVLTIVPPKDMKWKMVLDQPEGVAESVRGRFFVMESRGEDLGKITKLIEAGKVRPMVDSVWALEEYEKAFERADGGRTTGKVVIRVS